MTIWERVSTALSGLGVPMAANVYQLDTGDELPDQFLVYSLVSAPPAQHADDAETLRTYTVQVSIYDRAGLITLPDIAGAMVADGFTRGPLRELPRDEKTGHYGLALEFNYLEQE